MSIENIHNGFNDFLQECGNEKIPTDRGVPPASTEYLTGKGQGPGNSISNSMVVPPVATAQGPGTPESTTQSQAPSLIQPPPATGFEFMHEYLARPQRKLTKKQMKQVEDDAFYEFSQEEEESISLVSIF